MCTVGAGVVVVVVLQTNIIKKASYAKKNQPKRQAENS